MLLSSWRCTSGWWFGTFGLFFPSYWECHHPIWRTHIFQRGRSTTNQITFGFCNSAMRFSTRTCVTFRPSLKGRPKSPNVARMSSWDFLGTTSWSWSESDFYFKKHLDLPPNKCENGEKKPGSPRPQGCYGRWDGMTKRTWRRSWRLGGLVGISWEFLGISWDFSEFHGISMALKGDLVRLNGIVTMGWPTSETLKKAEPGEIPKDDLDRFMIHESWWWVWI